MDPTISLCVMILAPIAIALLVCMVWRGKMKTAKIARTAMNYIPPGGFRLTGSSDVFLYRTTTRVKISTSSSSSGSGGGGRSGGSLGGGGRR